MMSEHLQPPAVRSGIDVALWYQARAAASGVGLSARKLQYLLYLSQAFYAAAQGGRKLMPASFLAGPDGPYEPTLDLVLQCGLARPPVMALPAQVEAVLLALWQQYGPVPAPGIARLIAADGLASRAFADNPQGEISVTAMAETYAAALNIPPPPRPQPSPPTVQPSPPAREPRAAPAKAPPSSAGDMPDTIAAALATARAAAEAEAPAPVAAKPAAGEPSGIKRVPAGDRKAPAARPPRTAGANQPPSPSPSRLPPVERVRFTLDGREVKPWAPRRRVEKPAPR